MFSLSPLSNSLYTIYFPCVCNLRYSFCIVIISVNALINFWYLLHLLFIIHYYILLFQLLFTIYYINILVFIYFM